MKTKKSDLEQSIQNWKHSNPELALTFDQDYASFKIGVLLKQAREEAGLSQEELARMIDTKRTAISRLENHAQDVKLSTLEKVARALGKNLELRIA